MCFGQMEDQEWRILDLVMSLYLYLKSLTKLIISRYRLLRLLVLIIISVLFGGVLLKDETMGNLFGCLNKFAIAYFIEH